MSRHYATTDEHVGPAAGDVGVEVALLDRDGVIVWVNEAWEAFSRENGGDLSRTGVGVSYLDVCASSGSDPDSAQVAAAIRSAANGDHPFPMVPEVPCHSPEAARWFDMLVSSRLDDDGNCIGATVRLSLARKMPAASRVTPASIVDLLVQRNEGVTFDRLTDREIDVLEKLADGLSNRGIASEMHLSVKSIEGHITSIFRKLAFSDESLIDRRVTAALTYLRARDAALGLQPLGVGLDHIRRNTYP